MSRRDGFTIPFGVSARGILVTASAAGRDQKYHCPGCGDPLVLHAGDVVVTHFKHKPNYGGGCSEESMLHRTAKRLLVQVVQDAASGGPRPSIQRLCRENHTHIARVQELPPSVNGASEEVSVDSGHRVDVAIVGEAGVLAAVEVLVTHAVDDDKGTRLSVPWIELRAEDVVANPMVWRPTQDHFRPLQTCDECERERAVRLVESQERANRIERNGRAAYRRVLARLDDARALYERFGHPRPDPRFVPAITRCWQCRKDTVVFTWPGKGQWSGAPPHPIPPTIQLRYSKQAGTKYWANTCGLCRRLQGDHYLFGGGGPFAAIAHDVEKVDRWIAASPSLPPDIERFGDIPAIGDLRAHGSVHREQGGRTMRSAVDAFLARTRRIGW